MLSVSKICTIPFYPCTCNPGPALLPLHPMQSIAKRPYPTSPCPKSHPCSTVTFTTSVFHTPRSPLGALHPPPACCLLSTSSVCRNAAQVRHCDLYIPCWMDGAFLTFWKCRPHLTPVCPSCWSWYAGSATYNFQMCEKGHFPKAAPTSYLPLLCAHVEHLHCLGGWSEESRGGWRKIPVEFHKFIISSQ